MRVCDRPGMNTSLPNDRKLAEALRSLSIEPTTLTPEPRRRGRWTTSALTLVVTAGLACGATLAWYRSDDAGRLLAFLAAAIPVATEAASPSAADAPPTPAPIPATSAASEAVRPSSAPARRIAGSGYVTAPDFTQVTAKYAGDVVSVHVAAGDRVAAGDPLVTLQDQGAVFALREAVIALSTARLASEATRLDEARARAAFERAAALGSRQAVPQAQVDDARIAHDVALNAIEIAARSVETADLAVEKARERVDALVIRAPIAGTVTTLGARPGDGVSDRADARPGVPLATIVDTRTLVIDADVAEANLALLRPGQTGEAVLDGYPDRPFTVEVVRIAPIVAAETGTVALRLRLVEPPAGIRPNMAARISIDTGAAPVPLNRQGSRS